MLANVLAAAMMIGSLGKDFQVSTIDHQPATRQIFWSLLQKSGQGLSGAEVAAFIVRTPSGGLSIVPWPSPDRTHQARWRGSFPANVVAIAHTHPIRVPEPSPTDLRTARRIGVDIYVITRWKIVKIHRGGQTTVARGDWRPEVRSETNRNVPVPQQTVSRTGNTSPIESAR